MFSHFPSRILLALTLVSYSQAADLRTLRVCADPNNLPFSNRAEQGIENKLGSMLAQEMGAGLEYTWWSERKSFLQNSLNAGQCDVVLGVPAGIDTVLTSKPYYTSSYVIVTRRSKPAIRSLLDPALETCKIGVHVTGDDYAPPAQLLARRGLASNIVSFSLFGADGEPNPPSKLIDAVREGAVDVAVVWGPFAGYFGSGDLQITPVAPTSFLGIPFIYGISTAVRKQDTHLRDEIDRILDRRQSDIRELLHEYHFPVVENGP